MHCATRATVYFSTQTVQKYDHRSESQPTRTSLTILYLSTPEKISDRWNAVCVTRMLHSDADSSINVITKMHTAMKSQNMSNISIKKFDLVNAVVNHTKLRWRLDITNYLLSLVQFCGKSCVPPQFQLEEYVSQRTRKVCRQLDKKSWEVNDELLSDRVGIIYLGWNAIGAQNVITFATYPAENNICYEKVIVATSPIEDVTDQSAQKLTDSYSLGFPYSIVV